MCCIHGCRQLTTLFSVNMVFSKEGDAFIKKYEWAMAQKLIKEFIA